MKQITACEDWIEKISAEIDGELSLLECKRVADHLAVCEGCRAIRQAFLKDRARFVAVFDAVTMKVDLSATVLDRLSRRPLRPGWGRPPGGWFFPRPAYLWTGASLVVVLLCVVAGKALIPGRIAEEEPLRMASGQPAASRKAPAAEVLRPPPRPAPAAGGPLWETQVASESAGREETDSRSRLASKIAPLEKRMEDGGGDARREKEVAAAPAGLSPIPTSSPQSYKAQLHLQVASPSAALIQAERLVTEYHGTIVRSDFPALPAQLPPVVAQLTCRVSEKQMIPLLDDLRGLGKVISRHISKPPPAAPDKSAQLATKTTTLFTESDSFATVTVFFSETES